MGHSHGMMPAGGRLTASVAHWQSAGPAGGPVHRAGSGKSLFETKAHRPWYAATPLILLLSAVLWAMTAGGMTAATGAPARRMSRA